MTDNRTFAQVFSDFCKKHPEIAKNIDDYRPIAPYTLQFWMKDGTILHYDDRTDKWEEGVDEYALAFLNACLN